MEPGAENRWRVFDSSPARTASSLANRAISLTDRSTDWLASWGFFGGGLRMGECGEAGNVSPAAPHPPKLRGGPI
jgi:hypothetical protein